MEIKIPVQERFRACRKPGIRLHLCVRISSSLTTNSFSNMRNLCLELDISGAYLFKEGKQYYAT